MKNANKEVKSDFKKEHMMETEYQLWEAGFSLLAIEDLGEQMIH